MDGPSGGGDTVPEANITIALSDGVKLELAQIARESHVTEDELVERAVRHLLQAHRGPAIPRFARRLGPIAIDVLMVALSSS
jgi:hypothetical protein